MRNTAEWGWGVSGMTARNVRNGWKTSVFYTVSKSKWRPLKGINIFLYRGCMLKFSERLKRKILLKSQLLSLHQSVSTQGKGDRTCWLAGRKLRCVSLQNQKIKLTSTIWIRPNANKKTHTENGALTGLLYLFLFYTFMYYFKFCLMQLFLKLVIIFFINFNDTDDF